MNKKQDLRIGCKNKIQEMTKKNIFFIVFCSLFSLIRLRFNFPSQKRAISPVIATALLLIVAVVAVVGFSKWYTAYQTDLTSNVELQSSSNMNSGIEGIYDNVLYFRNDGPKTLYFRSVKLSGTNCVYSGSVASYTVGEIPFDNCSSNLSGVYTP